MLHKLVIGAVGVMAVMFAGTAFAQGSFARDVGHSRQLPSLGRPISGWTIPLADILL